jgi:ribonuclease P protein component
MVRQFGFPKAAHIRKRRDFLAVAARKNQFFGQFFVIQWKKRQQLCCRLGITIPKKYGKAVQRNRFKRLVREAFRLSCKNKSLGFDINVHPKKNYELATLSELLLDFSRFFSLVQDVTLS